LNTTPAKVRTENVSARFKAPLPIPALMVENIVYREKVWFHASVRFNQSRVRVKARYGSTQVRKCVRARTHGGGGGGGGGEVDEGWGEQDGRRLRPVGVPNPALRMFTDRSPDAFSLAAKACGP
jgi:hypothetical protein